MPPSAQSATLSLSTYPSLHTSIFGDEGGSLFGEGGLLGDMGDIFNAGTIGSGVGPGTSQMTVPRISSLTQFSSQASTTFQPHRDHILQGAGVGTPPLKQQYQTQPKMPQPGPQQQQGQQSQLQQQQQLQQQRQHTPSSYRHSAPISIPPSNDTQQQQPNIHHSQPPPQHPAQTPQPPRPQTMFAQGSVADLQKERVLAHKSSVATMKTTASSNSLQSQSDLSSRPLPSVQPPRGGPSSSRTFETDPKAKAQKEALKQKLKQQQKAQQKRSLPLFPTDRTRGSSSIQNALRPVDISLIDLLPIEVSHKIIMKCIDEIKLRGLKHKHLFRTPFYSPSVEGALAMMVDPRRQDMISVKWMRMDTVAGLLTTALSRTYPPLIPPHIQEMFQNPNGRFFFELLGMLPELNRFLFVEILDLCCDLVDNQLYNQVSHSKLAIYPGSCCFGLDEFMPTWDTRYLLTTDVKKFSAAFYHVIYAYREERDLSAEALQEKLDTRDRILEKERMDALESEYGLEGAFAILRMEARIAKGLPAESPSLVPTPPSNTKEISVYADRKERVVADDAISVLNIQLDETAAAAPPVQSLDKVVEEGKEEEEEENVEGVIEDLRNSVSVAALVYNSGSNSAASSSETVVSSGSTTPAQSSTPSSGPYLYKKSNPSSPAVVGSKTTAATRPTLLRLKSIARASTIEKNLYPVSPGDIFGISRHAIERKQLQEFLSVARISVKQRKSLSSKRILQLRLQNKLLRRHRSTPAASPVYPIQEQPSSPLQYHRNYQLQRQAQSASPSLQHPHRKLRIHPPAQNHTHWNRHQSLYQQTYSDQAKTPSLRRERTRQLRKELQVYLDRGLSQEEAILQNKKDKKRNRRKEKKAKEVAAKAEERRQHVEKAVIATAEERKQKDQITMEEAEVMEAFDYLTDKEFEEFMTLAGLTMVDVNRIREKAATAALKQVTKDIASADQSSVKATLQQESKKVQPAPMAKNADKDMEAKKTVQNAPSGSAISEPKALTVTSPASPAFKEGQIVDNAPKMYKSRPTSLPKMTSMDLLMKNTKVIGDSNLRCYPELKVSSPTTSIASAAEGTPTSISSSPATSVAQTSRRPSTIGSTDLGTVPEEDTPAAASISTPSSASNSAEIQVVMIEMSMPVAKSTPKTTTVATTTVEKGSILAATKEQKKKISPSSSSSSIPVLTARGASSTTTASSPTRTSSTPIKDLKSKSPSVSSLASLSSSRSTESVSTEKSRIPSPIYGLKKKSVPSPHSSAEKMKAVETTKVPESTGAAESKKSSVRDAIKALEGGPKPKSGVRDAIKAFERPAGSTSGTAPLPFPKLRPVVRNTTPISATTLPSGAAGSTLRPWDALRKKKTTTTATTTTVVAPSTEPLKPKEDDKKTFVSKSSMSKDEVSRVGHMKDTFKISTTKVIPTTVEITPLDAKKTTTPVPATAANPAVIPRFVLEIETMVDDLDDNKVSKREQVTKVEAKVSKLKNKEERLQILQVEEQEDEEAAELRELLNSMSEEERSEFLRLSRA
ncbi:hypothetical protein EMPS_02276 [Entomortierella parvispora]|uniref:Rho-GAP domain-containing protein n=1 Tax=Entomortierella parvispora TaxID=205924 RepID=A0A9P3H4J9_9FUNG|nr:hypothetical protein EMPS_02276 [Entomortierella parvispora]